MSKKLNDAGYCWAANELGCGVPIMKSVARTESAGDGFLSDGRIKIRFEGHKFRSFTGGKYDVSHPQISYPYSIQKHKKHGYPEFSIAFRVDPTAALLSTSFGKFQPMGFTHEEAGFDNVHDFVNFLKEGENNQLIAFCRLVKHRGLDDELKRGTLKDCAAFAKGYNGADYKSNSYDAKIYNGKTDFAAVDCKKILAEAEAFHEDAVANFVPGQSVDIPLDDIDESLIPPPAVPPVVDKVIIEKEAPLTEEKPKGFFAPLWQKVVAAFTAVGGTEVVIEKAQQAQTLGISNKTWSILFWIILGGIATWVIYHFVAIKVVPWVKWILGRIRTNTMVAANSTLTNSISVEEFTPEKIAQWEAAGFSIARRV